MNKCFNIIISLLNINTRSLEYLNYNQVDNKF